MSDLIEELRAIANSLKTVDERLSLIEKETPYAKQPCTDIPVALVEVIGGVAHVTRKDSGFLLRIIDRDAIKDRGATLQEATTTLMMEDVIKDEQPEPVQNP